MRCYILALLSVGSLVGIASGQQPQVQSLGERPLIKKRGTVDCGLVEFTPVVFRNRLYRFESVRPGYKKGFCPPEVLPSSPGGYFRFIDEASGAATPGFGRDYIQGCAFVHDDTMFVFGTALKRTRIQVFWSKDLKEWSDQPALTMPGPLAAFNTSVCKGRDGYVMAVECDGPKEEIGVRLTHRFAASDDLLTWRLLPADRIYSKETMTAAPALRYFDDYYYLLYGYRKYIQQPPFERHEIRIVRSRDLIHWESSPFNPVLRHSAEDKLIANKDLTAKQQAYVAATKLKKTSDPDLCEFEGKTVIYYSWGGNAGRQFLGRAEYDGTLKAFVTGFFPKRSD